MSQLDEATQDENAIVAIEAEIASDAIGLAEACRYQPSIEEIVSSCFSEYDFTLSGVKMLSSEVFSPDGMLPLFSSLAINKIETVLGIPLFVDEESDEDALFGIVVNPSFESASAFVIYGLQVTNIATEIFGPVPCDIELDELYRWALNVEMQESGLPYLGSIKDNEFRKSA